jgi:predicted HTH domain antitoxin
MTTVVLPNIKVDNSILLSLKETKEAFAKDMKFYTSMMLYKKNKLSLGKAANLADMDKFDFINRLKEEKIAIFDYNDEQLQDIFNGADRILKIIK